MKSSILLSELEEIKKRKAKVIYVIAFLLLIMVIWAYFAPLDEVARGNGRVVTWSKSQVIENRDGGVIKELYVREGDYVEKGQPLAMLDVTRFEADFNEKSATVISLATSVARLEAEVADDGRTPQYLSTIKRYLINNHASDEQLMAIYLPYIERENTLFEQRKKHLEDEVASLKKSINLSNKELSMIVPLVKKGAMSKVEEIRLEKEVTDLNMRYFNTKNSWLKDAKEELVNKINQLETYYYQSIQIKDQLDGSMLRSPVTGYVKDVTITTVGGVLAPGDKLMEVVPSGDNLLIEVKINPNDIAFIHPGQRAVVKITAYEPSIYGTLDAIVDRIMPDTQKDEENPGKYYSLIYVKTEMSALVTRDGKRHEIAPGMVAVADIKTGNKTVLDYILKPLNKAKEALRER